MNNNYCKFILKICKQPYKKICVLWFRQHVQGVSCKLLILLLQMLAVTVILSLQTQMSSALEILHVINANVWHQVRQILHHTYIILCQCSLGCDCDPNAPFPDDFCPANQECKQCKCLPKGINCCSLWYVLRAETWSWYTWKWKKPTNTDLIPYLCTSELRYTFCTFQDVIVMTLCPMQMSFAPIITNVNSVNVCLQVTDWWHLYHHHDTVHVQIVSVMTKVPTLTSSVL